MKNATRGTLCLILAIALLFCLLSCGGAPVDEGYDAAISFVIRQEAITYSDEFIETANNRFTEIAVHFIESYSGASLSAAQRQRVHAQFKKTFVPACLRVRVYQEELTLLLCELEGLIKEAEPGTTAFAAVYERLLYSIGSRRSGALLLELAKSFVSSKQKTAQERYEQYGYDWYREEAEELATLQNDLCTMGEEKFGAVVSMASLLASSAMQVGAPASDGRLALSDADIRFILEYHAGYVMSVGITEGEAQVFGRLISHLIPERSGTLLSAHLYALKTDGYFVEAARVIPHFAAFYASLTTALRRNGELGFGGDSAAAARALACALNDSNEELLSFLAVVDRYMSTASQRELNAIKQSDASDALARFLAEEHAMTDGELTATIQALSVSTSADAAKELQAAFVSRLIGVAPYVIFTLTE